ncbi:protein S100-A13 [Vipera latastei]
MASRLLHKLIHCLFDPQKKGEERKPASPEELTNLEMAIHQIIEIFFTYAAQEGDKTTLTPSGFKELVDQQLPNLKKNIGDLDKKMTTLDKNQDKVLEFKEYWQLIRELAKTFKREEVGKKK